MPWQRDFLGWKRPAIETAVEAISAPFAGLDEWDLSEILCVFPTIRACHQFEEVLAERAELAGAALVPPTVSTTGWLDRHILPKSEAIATSIQSRAAWASALACFDPQSRGFLLRRPPESDDWPRWMGLANVFLGVRATLASNRHSFTSAASRMDLFESDVERARWECLAVLESKYLAILTQNGLSDRLTYRERMLEENRARWQGRIFVVAGADLNAAQVALLGQASANGSDVCSLIAAPAEFADRFDDAGCLLRDRWLDGPIEVSDDRITFAHGPMDQALAALSIVGQLAPELTPGEVKIGVPDGEVTSRLVDAAGRLGVVVECAEGAPAKLSGPMRLLASAASYASTHSAAALAEVFRHPDFHEWLVARERITSISRIPVMIGLLDDYRGTLAPLRIDPASELVGSFSPDLSRALKVIAPLTKHLSGAPRSASQWSMSFSEFLIEVYGSRFAAGVNAGAPGLEAIAALGKGLRALAGVDAGAPGLPDLSAEQAIELLSGEIGEIHRPTNDANAVELLGWLDLPLERAPVLVVTGMNEGELSPRVESDMFLTEAIRAKLDLPSNEDRLARDRYALTLMTQSHRAVHLIAGQVTAKGDPRTPSRLLLGDTTEIRARRALAFFDSPGRRLQLSRGEFHPLRIEVPNPEHVHPIDGLSVTAFGQYLTCPYRFYLRHVLRLESVDDAISELDAAQFGSLTHQVLEAFGRDDAIRDSTDADAIRDYLDARVLELGRRHFRDSSPAIQVQLEQLRTRLARFALWQARWAGEGWRIRLTEQRIGHGVAGLDVDGETFWLRGMIDRVDVNERTGEVAILDYKTGDKGEDPEAAHRKRGSEWVNLQLPLYRHLLRALRTPDIAIDSSTAVRLGYILLPKDLDAIGEALADWEESDLREADETARGVVRDIRACRFGPMSERAGKLFPEFARICQDGVQREQT